MSEKDLKSTEKPDLAEVSEKEPESEENNPLDELQEYKNKYLYQLAEIENLKKRSQKEREELLRFGSERLIQEVLLVMDNLERAIWAGESSASKDSDAVTQGVKMVVTQLNDTLKKFGVERIKTEGENFDPQLHESVAQKPATEEAKANTILEEQLAGYTIHGRLLRAARVVVAASA